LETDRLPEYRVRISKRARSARIKVSPLGRVEVVIPAGVNPAYAAQLLQQRRDWLQKVLWRIESQRQSLPASHGLQPPSIQLVAIGEHWQLDYPGGEGKLRLCPGGEHQLIVHGEVVPLQLAELLRQWLQARARQVLPDWLRQVSDECGLAFNKVSIRGQKTRWGSCSSQHNINLNRNLLFVPAMTVRYLFVHELCHTLQMNHSPHYWHLVAQHVPDFRHHEKILSQIVKALPLWVYA